MKRSAYDDWNQARPRLESRQRILMALRGGGRTFTELLKETGLTRPTISKHLKWMMDERLVERVDNRGKKEFSGRKRRLIKNIWTEYRLTKAGEKGLAYLHFPDLVFLAFNYSGIAPEPGYMVLTGAVVHYCILKELETGQPWTLGLDTMIEGMMKETKEKRGIIKDFKENYKELVGHLDHLSNSILDFERRKKLGELTKEEKKLIEKIRRV